MTTVGAIANRRLGGGRAATLVVVAVVIALTSGCTGSSKGHAKQTTSPPGASSSNSTSTPTSGTSGTSGSGRPSQTGQSSSAPPPGQQTNAAIPISRTASFGGKVTASVPSVRAITATAKVQGEITGPAFAVTVKLVNDSNTVIDLDSAIINIGYGVANTPGIPMSGAPSAPFSGKLAAGQSKSAVYVFGVSSNKSELLRIEVSYSPTAPVVVFTGSA